ncbi:DUF5682 family protein [Kineosporia sp. NBRC 101731]|uniref:DUF5682 family protein n=1 Tax=Kineosporia sp. NBRC 101731 TaxID=3032199 RepID=UPI0024A321F5|nr:DUF5682 family protein [Kineosporia sp. NBRC 101731]GLY32641.1 hypothetical protein Kisp02_60060 [Kineosporia sp. NBRC 101731]
MPVTFIGVRHHSPACARLVASVIEELSPAYVLVEGPADLNGRIDELLLGHELPIAVFSSYRDEERRHASWAPFCEYSPEWVALTRGRAVGAQLRFIDLPSWHPAFDGVGNRYADAELRYAQVLERLCRSFGLDNVDVLWDHLVEIAPPDDLKVRLETYFDLVRGETSADEGDSAREAYMAQWVAAAAQAAGERPVVVVTGGFHRPALVAAQEPRPGAMDGVDGGDGTVPLTLGTGDAGGEGSSAGAGPMDVCAEGPPAGAEAGKAPEANGPGGTVPGSGGTAPGFAHPQYPSWPVIPALPDGAHGGSFLVPYSFRRLDAFDGYQSGMPSPGYYQALWELGPQGAARHLTGSVADRLRQRKQPVSTADLIAARATADALALVRGHAYPARTDVLDGLASALVNDALDVPLPWTARGTLSGGSHPVVVEMIAALSGSHVGRLHPATPAPPLVHDLEAELEREGLSRAGGHDLDLTTAPEARRSRLLHRVRLLGIPGFLRIRGPSTGLDPVLREQWTIELHPDRLAAVIEAGAYGATLTDAAAAALTERAVRAGTDVDALAAVLFDAALAGLATVLDDALSTVDRAVGQVPELAPLGRLLAVVLTMWRHDEVFGTTRNAALGAVIAASVRRILWLVEGLHGGPEPADRERIAALAACRDGLRHAGPALGLDVVEARAVVTRVAADVLAPPDLRGASFGFQWSLSENDDDRPDPLRVLRGAFQPRTAGDWLAGLFALARDEVLHDEAVLTLLDDLMSGLSAEDFLIGLPALRQAFGFFPPRERAVLAEGLLARRGLPGSGRAFVRAVNDPQTVAVGMALDERVDAMVRREGLIVAGEGAQP